MSSPTFSRATLAGLLLAASARSGTITLSALNDTTIYAGEQHAGQRRPATSSSPARTNVGPAARALLRFDVAAALPPARTIVSAHARADRPQDHRGPQPVRIHRLLADWSEGRPTARLEGAGGVALPATLHGPRARSANRCGPRWAATSRPSRAPRPASTIHDAHLGPDARDGERRAALARRPDQNAGWIVIGAEGLSGSSKRFDSRTNPSAAGPTLTIDFNPPCTPASYCNRALELHRRPRAADQHLPADQHARPVRLSASGLPPNAPTTSTSGQVRGEEPFLNSATAASLGHIYRAAPCSRPQPAVATRTIDLAILPANRSPPTRTWCFPSLLTATPRRAAPARTTPTPGRHLLSVSTVPGSITTSSRENRVRYQLDSDVFSGRGSSP
jgi:hypothetical protein